MQRLNVQLPEADTIQRLTPDEANVLLARAREAFEPHELGVLAVAVSALLFVDEVDAQRRPKPPLTPEQF